MRTALLFPGQGSQFVGMGKELYDNFVEAKEVFQLIDEVLQQNLSKLIFYGDIIELTKTYNAQPAIMAVSQAVIAILKKSVELKVEYTCGHSLGEYSAYAFAQAFDLATTTKLLRKRGEAMSKACALQTGSMVALLGANMQMCQKLLEEASKYGICCIANDNGADQIVISGSLPAIDKVMVIYKEFGIKKAIKLNVEGAFHSPLMETAAQEMQNELAYTHFQLPTIPVIANVSVSQLESIAEIKDSLVNQITKPVQWRKTMELLLNENVEKFIEIGPSSVLTNIAKKMAPNAICKAVSNPGEIEELVYEL